MAPQASTAYLRPRELERMRKTTRAAAARAVEMINSGTSRDTALVTVGISGRSFDRYLLSLEAEKVMVVTPPAGPAPALSLWNADHERRIAELEGIVARLLHQVQALRAGLAEAVVATGDGITN